MELKGSRTEANLMAAFAGESQARNKYTYLLRLRTTKKNTLKCGLNYYMVEVFQIQWKI